MTRCTSARSAPLLLPASVGDWVCACGAPATIIATSNTQGANLRKRTCADSFRPDFAAEFARIPLSLAFLGTKCGILANSPTLAGQGGMVPAARFAVDPADDHAARFVLQHAGL